MMKYKYVSGMLSMMLVSVMFCSAQVRTAKLQATFKNAGKGDKVVLSYSDVNARVIDTIMIKDKKILVEQKWSINTRATLTWIRKADQNKQTRPDRVHLYLSEEPIQIVVRDSMKYAKFNGSKLNADYQNFMAVLKPADDVLDELDFKWRNMSKEEQERFWFERSERTRDARGQRKQLMLEYAAHHPSSYFSLQSLIDLSVQSVDYRAVHKVFDNLDSTLKNTTAGRKLKERIDIAGNIIVGVMAPDFVQNDVNDKPVRLSGFRGKYVLLDFWASWCAPCRAENPNLVKLYDRYAGDSFEILGVSLDYPGKKQAWVNAIEKDKLPWVHVSDLKGWDNEVAKLYAVRGVPQTFLIDPQGKIIAVSLSGESLAAKLKEVFQR
ncbi:TlpA disulfide reductase family protein [Sphingobacterium faecale]|uniref:AhpC/TSA family protein n=1 Tax=Sphingobacterium faecale TaxID=2803775 RepID=A0ABS1RB18_9SPHI|nr:TlpA disulfide reductase family protein [Sphingobacterium faecale]MBL1411217.1 AhpC/TSA family protein [Sphingobacterium faecale]